MGMVGPVWRPLPETDLPFCEMRTHTWGRNSGSWLRIANSVARLKQLLGGSQGKQLRGRGTGMVPVLQTGYRGGRRWMCPIQGLASRDLGAVGPGREPEGSLEDVGLSGSV